MSDFGVSKSKIIFWVYCLAIVLLTVLPLNTNSPNSLNDISILHFRGDYFFHALLFMPWVFLIHAMKEPIWLWLLLGLLFSSGCEFIQYFLPYRSFNINDLLANIIGIALGFLIWISFKKKAIKTSPRQ